MISRVVSKIRIKIDGYRYRRQLQEQVGCPCCKHYFTYYKHDNLCACSVMEVIDYTDGFYINAAGEDCGAFAFDGNADWFETLE